MLIGVGLQVPCGLLAAKYMRVSVRWLRQHLKQVPHSKVAGRLFVSRTELDAWLAEKRRS